MNNIKQAVTGLLSLVVALSATATPIYQDANVGLINHGTYSADAVTGFDWLNLDQTEGYSYDYVAANLQVGEQFEGWNIATFSQVYTLFDAAGGNGVYGNSYGHDVLRTNLLSGWGAGAEHAPGDIWAFVLDDPTVGSGTGFSLGCYQGGGRLCEWVNGFQHTHITYSNHGVALYRLSAAEVSEPSILALIGLGLAALGFTARRKKLLVA